MARKAVSFTVDSDAYSAIRPLATKYGVNLSEVVNTALFEILQALREVDSLSRANSGTLPTDVARTYLKQKISRIAGDQQSVIQELYPEPVKAKSKAKVKA